MMKKVRSFLSLALVLCMVLSLTACSGGSGDSSSSSRSSDGGTDSSAASDSQVSTEEQGDPAELTIGFYINSTMPTDMDMVVDAINEILLEKANAQITDTVILNYGNYLEQITLMLSGNEKLDTFLCRNSSNFIQYVSRGQLMEMDDLLAEYGQGVIEAVGQDFLDAGMVDGHTYGITTNRDLAKEYGFSMLKSYVDKYNIDIDSIETMDDMGEVFAIIKENEPNMIPWVSTVGANSLMEFLIGADQLTDSCGVLMNYGQDEPLKVVNYFATEEYEYWCNYMHDFYEKGYIAEDFLTTSDQPHDLMRAHQAFAMSTGLKPGFDTQESQVVGEEVVSVALTECYTTSTIVQTAQWCIPHNATEPEAAMRFLNLLYTDADLINLFDWGIEGTHYVKTEDGHITYPEGVNAENSGYSLGLGWIFGNQYLSYVWEGDDLDLYDQLKDFNDSAIKSGAFGFVYDSNEVKTEVAAVSNVLNEYRAGLEFGVMDPETTLPEFLSALEAAGINTIIEEKQRQLDEWVSAQG